MCKCATVTDNIDAHNNVVLVTIIVANTHCSLIQGDMAVHYAAEQGHLDIVKYLISEAGVDKDVRGEVSWFGCVFTLWMHVLVLYPITYCLV